MASWTVAREDVRNSALRREGEIHRLICHRPAMRVFRQGKRACALQVAGKALSSQGTDRLRGHM